FPGLPDQRARASAAIATATPMLAAVGFLAMLAGLGSRQLSAAEHVETGSWPRKLDAPSWAGVAGWAIIASTLLVPLAALVASLKESFHLMQIWREFTPQLVGTL